jgi:soluble lytic murein transglycosylase-like protein
MVRVPGLLPAGFLLVALCPAARAMEHVTLRNGFELDCVRHEPLGTDRVRLYMSGEGNYQDLRAADIVGFETLPDPPPVVVAAVVPAVSSTFSATDMRELLASAGAAHNIDEDLLASVVHTESGGHANAVSHAGARGLMQLMPGTAHELGVKDSSRPDQNIAGGTAYLDSLLKRYKDNLALALAAYNAGPGAVDKYHGIPPFRETRAYVARVIRDFNRRKRAAALNSVAAAVASR